MPVAIDKPSKYFNTVTYTGTGSNQSVTGVGFKPDLVWIKNRNVAQIHVLTDAVRGVTKRLSSNATTAEVTDTFDLTSFNSDGFTVNGDTRVSESPYPYVSWNWLGANTTVSNTSGTITSTVSANTTSGFSIVSYTGNGSTNQTVGHGLGVAPDFIIVKARSTTMNWPTYSKKLGNGVAFLDVTDAWNGGAGYTNYWYTTGMTSSTFGISNNVNTNTSSATYIAYCFAAIKGYSAFGSYTGNGSTDGTFVYTGFKPAFVLMKCSSGIENWDMYDNKRDTFNVVNKMLKPNLSNVEASFNTYDFLSNGFKNRQADAEYNQSGRTYIYMAFAENPFVSSKGIACTAR